MWQRHATPYKNKTLFLSCLYLISSVFSGDSICLRWCLDSRYKYFTWYDWHEYFPLFAGLKVDGCQNNPFMSTLVFEQFYYLCTEFSCNNTCSPLFVWITVKDTSNSRLYSYAVIHYFLLKYTVKQNVYAFIYFIHACNTCMFSFHAIP